MPDEPIRINSLDDDRIEIFRNVRDKDLRGRGGLFMAESELVLRRLLRTPERLHAILLSPSRYDALRDALAQIDDHTTIYIADVDLMTRIAGFHIHRGVLAAGVRPAPAELSLDNALGHLRGRDALRIVVAEGLTNVDNLGALFRNAAGFGVDAIVLDPDSCDPLYRKAIRVSMGHVLSIPWAVADDWPADLVRLRNEWGLTLHAVELTDAAQPLRTLTRHQRLALLFGSERHGLSDEAIAACDAVGMIPMAADVPSLNVAVASAIALYELTRAPTEP
jgi:tRNA G18 (ribose-2'-O)-methylase SpoU